MEGIKIIKRIDKLIYFLMLIPPLSNNKKNIYIIFKLGELSYRTDIWIIL